MKRTRILALLLAVLMLAAVFSACKSNSSSPAPGGSSAAPGENSPAPGGTSEQPSAKDPITFTMFIAGPGEGPAKDNKISKKIQELTGVTIEFEYLVGDMEQKVGVMIAGGDYPDIIGAGQARGRYLNAGSLVALDDYLPQYPNLWKHFSPYEKRLRDVSEDGKIYLLDIWGRAYRLEDGQDDYYEAAYNGPAFWVQKDVLAWDNYSYPKTPEALFDLLERYTAANPTIDGQPTLPFEVHSQDWRSFCLKNAPQHLIGGRNEGDVVVDINTREVEIYQNKQYAKDYYGILNAAYKKGLINAETFTRNYDQYLSVISTGRVLAMFDQQWNFQNGEDVLISEGKFERTYVPLGISYEGNAVPYNRQRDAGIIGGNGIGISVDCKDVPRALEFMDQMLSEEIQTLLYWGIEGEDYYVDENGRYRRTPEQKANFDNADWKLANTGHELGNQFRKIEGRLPNGNAAFDPNLQPEEKLETQVQYDKDFLSKYGYYTKNDFLPTMAYPGYPEVWSIFSNMTEDNVAKPIFDEITDLENRYLPGVIMANDFEAAWAEYAARYEKVDYPALEKEIEAQIAMRYTE